MENGVVRPRRVAFAFRVRVTGTSRETRKETNTRLHHADAQLTQEQHTNADKCNSSVRSHWIRTGATCGRARKRTRRGVGVGGGATASATAPYAMRCVALFRKRRRHNGRRGAERAHKREQNERAAACTGWVHGSRLASSAALFAVECAARARVGAPVLERIVVRGALALLDASELLRGGLLLLGAARCGRRRFGCG